MIFGLWFLGLGFWFGFNFKDPSPKPKAQSPNIKNMIIITTPTGHIGSQVLEKLLKTDEKLRVIARDPSKLSGEAKERAEIIQGSLDDPEVVSKAYEGADELFFVVPPDMQYMDVNEYYLGFAGPTCDAIKRQAVKRVIFVSGTGLGYEKKAGPVSAADRKSVV